LERREQDRKKKKRTPLITSLGYYGIKIREPDRDMEKKERRPYPILSMTGWG